MLVLELYCSLRFKVYIIDLFRYLVNHVICYIDQHWGLVLLLVLWGLLGSYIYRATRNDELLYSGPILCYFNIGCSFEFLFPGY